MDFPCSRSRLFDHCFKIADAAAEPPPPPPPPPPSDHYPRPGSLPLVGFVIGASMLFGVFYIVIVRFFIKRPNLRQRSLRNPTNPTDPPILFDTQEEFLDEEQGPTLDHPIWYIRTVGLDQSAIDSIAAFKFKKGEGMIDGTDCSVCLTEFEDDETLRLLPKCSHAFHVPCIDMWLRSHKNCPLCRAPVMRAAPAAADAASTAAAEGSNIAASVSEVEEEGQSSGSGAMTEIADSGDTETRVLTDPVQGLRRSESVDAASASEIYRAVGIAINGGRRERIKKGKNLSLNLNPSSNSRVIGSSFRLYRMMMKSCSFGSSVHHEEEHGKMKSSSSSTRKILRLPSQ